MNHLPAGRQSSSLMLNRWIGRPVAKGLLYEIKERPFRCTKGCLISSKSKDFKSFVFTLQAERELRVFVSHDGEINAEMSPVVCADVSLQQLSLSAAARTETWVSAKPDSFSRKADFTVDPTAGLFTVEVSRCRTHTHICTHRRAHGEILSGECQSICAGDRLVSSHGMTGLWCMDTDKILICWVSPVCGHSEKKKEGGGTKISVKK